MKKTEEVIGLPIISICDGEEVGKVKGVIVNAAKGAADYVVVENGIQILNARVISANDVIGIGEYALTIENESVINDISKLPAAIDHLQKNVPVKGTRVMTKKGRLIGEIGDIYIDEDNSCSIFALEFISGKAQKSIRLIPRESVITFGKNLIVVQEEVEAALVDDISLLEPGAGSVTGQTNQEQTTLEVNAESGAMNDLMEKKHRDYLNGKLVSKTIFDNEGKVLIEEDTLIDDDVFDLAKAYDKVIDLVMNNK
ncbi:MAG TPA: hypothetical protein VHP38_16455 [Ruminiclostridium sp.]|nr:hypothetical protein [Ruminiclostridium sp.]